tara:strand:+ start:1314 stop:1568 length:255 start_codon:yes stop_codon:yes gene_type:complete
MTLAQEVNILLDELSKQIKVADQIKIDEIKARLNKVTREGEIIKDIFTNDYYVNNMMIDKALSNKADVAESVDATDLKSVSPWE